MQFRNGIIAWSIISASAVLSGCATDGSSGGATTFMQKCMAKATTKQEKSDCAYANAERMSSGR